MSYNMVVTLLYSPLQTQCDGKVILNKKATLVTGGFSLAEVYHKWVTKKH